MIVQKILKRIFLLNLLVFLLKLFIGFRAVSLSIVGDAVHSGIDGLNNIIALVMIRFASEPPDQEHPYGHSKFETLGALAVVAFLAIAAFELIEKSIMRLFEPSQYPIIDNLVYLLLFLTLFINIFVWIYEKRAGEKYKSQILLADASHTFADILITISVLLTSVFIQYGYAFMDPVLGIIIALLIFRTGWKILSETIPILVDEAWLDLSSVEVIVFGFDKAIEISNFRSRKVHERAFLEMSIKFKTDSLQEAHEISHLIESQIIQKYGDAQITIHIEPGL